MDAKSFIRSLKEHNGISFYAGVPDSLLKDLCNTLYTDCKPGKDFFV